MKKVLLLAVLLVSGLCMMAQTTVEEKKANIFNGATFRMQCIGNHLAYNGVRITEGNTALLLGDEVAAQYQKARKHEVMGDAFVITGTTLAAAGILAVLLEHNMGDSDDISSTTHTALKVGGYVAGGIGIAMLPVGITFRVKGIKAMEKIANDFNSQHNVVMIKLNPSMMNCKSAEMQNQHVLGATMSLAF